MSLGSLLKGLGGNAGKTVEAPLRAIVHEVLKEQGYASPAELQALRDELRAVRTRVDGLEGRVAELVKLLEAARADAQAAREAAVRLTAAASAPAVEDGRIATLEAEIRALSARLATRVEAAPAAAAPVAAAVVAAAPLSAAPKGKCKVAGCDKAVRSKGFCSAHYQQWRRGTLKGFVGLDGLAELDGRVIHLSPDLAGGVLTSADGAILVDGQAVSERTA